MSEDAQDEHDRPTIEQWWSGGEGVPVPWGPAGPVDVFVRRAGSGPTVTVLHGWPTSTYDFAAVERRLADRAELLLVDLVGSGASDKPEGAYPIGRQADVIEAVWARLGTGRTTLLAHDYGTIVAQELLARRREGAAAGPAIDGIVWLNGSIYPQHYRPTDLQTALVDPEVGPQLAEAVDGAAFAAGFPALFGPEGAPSADLLDQLWRGIARRDGHHRWPQVLGYMAERAAHGDRYVAALDEVVGRIPNRFVWGLDDAVSGKAIVDELRQRHPAAAVVALDGVGHYPQLERPDAVAAAVRSLLDELD